MQGRDSDYFFVVLAALALQSLQGTDYKTAQASIKLLSNWLSNALLHALDHRLPF